MRIHTSAMVLAGLLAAATACDGSGSASTGDGTGARRLKVVATTTQVADFARDIGGDKVKVTQLLKPNVDPHDYEPSPADIQAIAEADVVVENGVRLERWLDQTIKSAGFHGTLVDTSKGVPIRKGDGTEEEAAGDPHIWHDPKNAELMSRNIAAAFEATDPSGKAAYAANLASYTTKLDRLDSWIAQQIGTLPAGRRELVTNHDAFGYYIDRYHLTFVGSIIPSFDTSAELSGKRLDALVAKIKATGVKAIFSESSLPPKTAEAIGKQAGVKVEAGEESLYGDTLGPAGSAGATYIDMERHNTTTIVTALKG
ncbi:metal ABC transporter substrate-binding protein [Actinoallomurus iriomotensis]|uniref:Metal ABC transporter substrate-binding protein n=1 Tax=Actinoallomurus iriomotensis TaxID=478107 RepID=A0A9W6S463_9ACTN|nr:metal ABC transporter substrate-binding protein [Actinoallomurus iriomotensis]GLY88271.1 metal ABC transporter substrate-binding protein [Actinoallomurus iriomotensis]